MKNPAGNGLKFMDQHWPVLKWLNHVVVELNQWLAGLNQPGLTLKSINFFKISEFSLRKNSKLPAGLVSRFIQFPLYSLSLSLAHRFASFRSTWISLARSVCAHRCAAGGTLNATQRTHNYSTSINFHLKSAPLLHIMARPTLRATPRTCTTSDGSLRWEAKTVFFCLIYRRQTCRRREKQLGRMREGATNTITAIISLCVCWLAWKRKRVAWGESLNDLIKKILWIFVCVLWMRKKRKQRDGRKCWKFNIENWESGGRGWSVVVWCFKRFGSRWTIENHA
jgi:hypothetical protein